MQIRIPHVNILIVIVFQVKKHLIYTNNILFSSVLSVSDLDIMISHLVTDKNGRNSYLKCLLIMTKLANIAFRFELMLLKMLPIYTLMVHSEGNHTLCISWCRSDFKYIFPLFSY